MPGYLHIFLLERQGDGGSAESTYQVSYIEPGVTFVRAFDQSHLSHFLTAKLAMDSTGVERILSQIRSTGHANIADVELSAQEAAAFGLGQSPSET